MYCGLCCAQNDPAIRLVNQVRSDVALLEGGETFGAWRAGHSSEIATESPYLTKDSPREDNESLFTQGKCNVSVGSLQGQVKRTALFHAPFAAPGKLAPLPARLDRTLTRRCDLDELWYNVRSPVRVESVVAALESAWGKANGQSEEIGLANSGLWHNVMAWHRAGWNAWIVPNPANSNGESTGSLMVSVRRTGIIRDSDLLVDPPLLVQRVKVIAEESASELARIAALDPSLSEDMVRHVRCAAGAPVDNNVAAAADRLEKWINAAKDLPRQRRAAALLLADDYMTCMNDVVYKAPERFEALGAEFYRDEYGQTFRRGAEKLDQNGPVGAWAQLADAWTYCAVEGGEEFVAKAEKLLVRFPKWSPDLHYLIGRAHATSLAFAFPGGFPDDGAELAPLSPASQMKERLAAVQAFRRFIHEKPEDAEAPFAWQEAWRLLAGLKPSAVTFGCTGE
jgi:hypothetical protein